MKVAKRCLLALLMITSILTTQGAGAQVEFSQELYAKLAQGINPAPQIVIPAYQRIALKNGLVIYLAENHSLPIFAVNGLVRWGREAETLKNAGISDLMLRVIEEQVYGGEIGEYYRLRGIRVQCDLTDDKFDFNMNALSSEKEALLSIVYEILCNVDFRSLEWVRAEWEKDLKQKATDEKSLLYKYFYQNIFKGHPYSFEDDYSLALSNLKKLSLKELKNYYQQAFRPNNMILFIYGDFNSGEVLKKLGNFYNDLKPVTGAPEPPMAVENPDSHGKILLVDKADAEQARIIMGCQIDAAAFLKQDLDAQTAFEVGNEVLGGGDFGSHLMDEIRSNKGYVYDIDSQYFCGRLGGAFRITTSVKPDKACETVAAIKQMVQGVKTGTRKLTPAEVDKVINQRNAFYPEQYRDPEALIDSLVYLVELKNRAVNYHNQYIASYNKVTAVSAQAALERWLTPEKMFTVIVGKKEDILPTFQKANIPVTVVRAK